MSSSYKGRVSRIFFSNSETIWTAGVLDLEGGGTQRFAGDCLVAVGDQVTMTGPIVSSKYGPQIDVKKVDMHLDDSIEGLVALLGSPSSGFKGIGPKRARAIVSAAASVGEQHGDTAFDALRFHPAGVAEASGVKVEIVQQAAQMINARADEYAAIASIMDAGWTTAQAQAIIAEFGSAGVKIARDDPFELVGRVARFGFRTVDAVARAQGVPEMDPKRLACGIAYVLDQIASNGDTIVEVEDLIAKAGAELRPNSFAASDSIRDIYGDLVADGTIAEMETPAGKKIAALMAIARTESSVFERLTSWIRAEVEKPMPIPSDGKAGDLFAQLNAGQRAAVIGIARRKLSIIAGGAGVGKTFTMRAVCEIAEAAEMRVALCAPTGKAARQLEKSTGREALTIHRTLAPRYDETKGRLTFDRGRDNPIPADLIIVDEVSMLDVLLASSLLDAISLGSRVLFVGDHNQIPSVGAGAILRDLLSMASKPDIDSIHILTEVVRQAGVLARNTSAILDGVIAPDEPPAWGIDRADGSASGSPSFIAAAFEMFATTEIEALGRAAGSAFEIQVLAPTKKGPLGTWALNIELQAVRQRLLGNPPPPPVKLGERAAPLVGDRIIWTKNDYELDLLNGTQAIVREIGKGRSMKIETEDGRVVNVSAEKANRVELAYAMTIHKSQGSEWPVVILVASSSHYVMHDRNLLYTGASRAQLTLVIHGDARGMRSFATSRKSERRKTLGAYLVHGWRPQVIDRATSAR